MEILHGVAENGRQSVYDDQGGLIGYQIEGKGFVPLAQQLDADWKQRDAQNKQDWRDFFARVKRP